MHVQSCNWTMLITKQKNPIHFVWLLSVFFHARSKRFAKWRKCKERKVEQMKKERKNQMQCYKMKITFSLFCFFCSWFRFFFLLSHLWRYKFVPNWIEWILNKNQMNALAHWRAAKTKQNQTQIEVRKKHRTQRWLQLLS